MKYYFIDREVYIRNEEIYECKTDRWLGTLFEDKDGKYLIGPQNKGRITTSPTERYQL